MLYYYAVYRIARAETHGEITLKTFYLLESSSIYSSAIYDGPLHHSLVSLLYNALPVLEHRKSVNTSLLSLPVSSAISSTAIVIRRSIVKSSFSFDIFKKLSACSFDEVR